MLHLYCTNGGKKRMEFEEDALRFTNGVNKNRVLEIDNPECTNDISLVGRALTAPVRIQILHMLNKKPMLLSQIAAELDLPLSSAAFHLRVLEDAQLITIDFSTKRKGTLKWYSYALPKTLILRLRQVDGGNQRAFVPYSQSINIGDYIDADFSPYCGIATERQHIMEDEPRRTFIPERRDAQIIWSRNSGDLLYAVPNDYAIKGKLSEINFSAELCSETMGYNNEYPSDITFWINDTELCTFTCPGDYGDRYGKYTPPWWFPESTKYGLLTTVSIRERGVYLNEKLVNKRVKLGGLNLTKGNRTTLKIGVKKDAEHLGGFNIFGDKFGDYNQGIVFTAIYENN